MKNILRTMLPAVVLMAFLGGSALAQSKIATVDLDKIYSNYWKTKQAMAAINTQKADFDKEYRGMTDDLSKANDEYQKLLDQSNDQALSGDERDRRKQAAADKFKQLQDSKAAIDQFGRSAQARLTEQSQRMQQDVFKEIKAAVAAKAKADGDTLVISTTLQTVVLYNKGDNDLTDPILAQLNALAPPDTSPAVMQPPSFSGTNK